MLPYQVKADDRHHQRAEKENPPECSRLSQKEDTGQHRAYGTYSTPYGITRTYCNTIFTADRLEEHKHADGNTGEKGEEPQKSRLARCCRYLFQTKGKKGLEQSANNKKYPVCHSCNDDNLQIYIYGR